MSTSSPTDSNRNLEQVPNTGSYQDTKEASIRDFKLCNILLEPLACFAKYPQLLYRLASSTEEASTSSAAYDKQHQGLNISGNIDFLTYFNALSTSKWKCYTNLESAFLHVELEAVKGEAKGELQLVGVDEDAVSADWVPHFNLHNDDSAIKQDISVHPIGEAHPFDASKTPVIFDVEIPFGAVLLASFTLTLAKNSSVRIKNAYYYARVSPQDIRPIKLAIATTTFNNENYIAPNIELFKKEIATKDEPISRASHLFVVDNGRTLVPQEYETDAVSIIPNANVGGSGGFARGMMAALEKGDFTHVLLMDDDVSIQPESFLRTFNLLSLARDTYADACVNGAMFTIETPNMQFEDVSQVGPDGQYARIKGNLYMDHLADIAVNEKVIAERPNTYGAWWFSCIPVAKIVKHGLPLPLFVRLDDVEYGLRLDAHYMTMNGICVWHAGFGDRFRASVDVYQYLRNYLAVMALDNLPFDKLFILRTRRSMQLYLRMMAYDTAELMLQALEDYLKGPQFFENPQGEKIMKENGARNEKLERLPDALRTATAEHPDYAAPLSAFEIDPVMLKENVYVPFWLKLWRTLPYDRHLLPSLLLRKKPATIYYGGFTLPSLALVGTSVLVAADRGGTQAHVRIMDKKRYKSIKRRWKKALKQYKRTYSELRSQYQQARPNFTSEAFWKEYLDRALQGTPHPQSDEKK